MSDEPRHQPSPYRCDCRFITEAAAAAGDICGMHSNAFGFYYVEGQQ